MANSDGIGSLAAIFCEHVASRKNPILRAVRDDPQDPDDSGWQFLCASCATEDPSAAQVWLVDEVLFEEPSLDEYIDSPAGTRLERKSSASPWIKTSAAKG